ncbi:hypothetical protein Q1695_006588 [Nippostrongylus brasiliensis]|nr:hypothetical protein Q1695_006588 [Nippostrongylus brasiliensis]
MLDEIGYLIKGHDGLCKTKERFSWLCRMFEVCRERPIHFHGTKVSAEFLHAHFLIRLYHLGLDDFKKNVNSVLNSLRDFDEQLYYFVLVSSYRLPDMYLCSGIKSHFVENYQYPIELASSAEVDVDCSSLPRLLWDISPALDPNVPISEPTAEEPIEPGEICPLDARGMVTQQFSKLLAWDTFHSSGSRRDEGKSGRVHFLQREVIVSAVLDLLAGVSSDIFQEKDGNFFLVTWCKADCWSTVLTQAATSSILQLTNRIFCTQRAISDRNEGQLKSDKLLNATVSAVAEVSDLLRDRLLHIPDDCASNQRFFEDLFTILEAHSQFLDVCRRILQSPEIQIIQLIYTVRCIRDSMQYAFSRSAYDVMLKALVRSAAISICVFVNTGRCDFADLVFIESVPAKVSPDRNDYGEIWESNFNVDLPSSPDFSSRLCREVVKHGVLVKLLRGDIAGKSGEFLHLLDLYGIRDSQIAVDLDEELLNVSSHVEEVLKDGVDTSTLENLVEWIMW